MAKSWEVGNIPESEKNAWSVTLADQQKDDECAQQWRVSHPASSEEKASQMMSQGYETQKPELLAMFWNRESVVG